ncbi:hypothetical protein [Nocardioides sp.]|uniref:hypothetical protein n=1 Tax=Nocardioides sp. TaxID=35761 RepID=UPI0026103B60|nr:hypothetical protein [Nocardioides sp.]MCW2735449.1 hypothetical protein [Nocardioides sp.]
MSRRVRFTDWMAEAGFDGLPGGSTAAAARAEVASDPDAWWHLTPDEVDGCHALYCWELGLPMLASVSVSPMDEGSTRSLAGFVIGAAS